MVRERDGGPFSEADLESAAVAFVRVDPARTRSSARRHYRSPSGSSPVAPRDVGQRHRLTGSSAFAQQLGDFQIFENR